MKLRWNLVLSCPLQSLQVDLRGVSACCLKGFWTVSWKNSAFGRQGPEVQILSPRPFIPVVSMSCDSRSRLHLAGVPLWHICGTRRNIYGHYSKKEWPLSRLNKKERIPSHYWYLFKADCCQKMDCLNRGRYREQDVHRLFRSWNNDPEWSSQSIRNRATSIKEGKECWTLPNWYSAATSRSLQPVWFLINQSRYHKNYQFYFPHYR